MKIFWPLLSCFIFFACKSNESTNTPATDEWVLTNKKTYKEKLNAFGLPDTTYIKSYTYENFDIKDSTELFAVSKYDDDRRLITKSFFAVKKDSLPILRSQINYRYSGKQVANVKNTLQGIITENIEYTYDTSGRLLQSTIVSLKNLGKISEDENQILQNKMVLQQGYDTLHGTYQYDTEKNRVIGGDFVDNRGISVRRDVNIYSGSSPVASYSLSPKGDTIQRISYENVGKAIKARSENAEYIITTMIFEGITTGKITEDKKNNIRTRQDWIYVDGRLVEEKFYRNENKKNL